MPNCLNCDKAISEKNAFCTHCGQKTSINRLTLWSIIKDFLSNLFNVETKIWRTFRDIWLPSKLTKAFVAGKRIQYYNPLRIFLVVLFAFFTLFLFQMRDAIDEMSQFSDRQEETVWTKELMMRFDSLAAIQSVPIDTLENFKKKLFEIKEKTLENDSILLEGLILEDKNIDISEAEKKDRRGKFSFEKNDLFVLSNEELLKKYSDGNPWKDLVMIQLQKVLKNLNSSIKFFIGNGTWAIIAVILLIAAFFKLLYIRHEYLYTEHFIFHLYGHTRMLLLALLAMFSDYLGFENSWFIIWLCIGLIYLYVSMLMYYKQSKTKTFVKWLLTLFAYMVLLVICSALIMGVSFLVL